MEEAESDVGEGERRDLMEEGRHGEVAEHLAVGAAGAGVGVAAVQLRTRFARR